MSDPDHGGPDEDAALMQRVRSGDRRAFSELYDRNVRSVVNFAFRFVQDRARAEELTQEIFLKLFRSAAGYQPTARFKTYLFRIASNHCLNERRRGEYRADQKGGSEGELDRVPAPQSQGPEEALQGRDLEARLGVALSRLTDRERAAFSLCRFEGLAYKEIAEALDTSESAVKSLIHRATVAVAKELTAVVGEDPLAAARAR